MTQISTISSLGNLAMVPKSGASSGVAPLFASKFGDLFAASFGTVMGKKIATPSISLQNSDPLAALQALLAQGVPPSAIVDKAAEILGTKPPPQTAGPPDTGPPDVRAKNLLATLQAMLAQIQGSLPGEQTNDLSGTHLAAGTPAKVPPARSEKSVATPVATASLRSLISSISLGFMGSQAAAPAIPLAHTNAVVASMPQPAQSATQLVTQVATGTPSISPLRVTPPTTVPNDLLGRMLGRAVLGSLPATPELGSIVLSPAASVVAATPNPIQNPSTGTQATAQPGDSSATSSGVLGLDHLVLSALTQAAQGDSKGASSGFGHEATAAMSDAPLPIKTAATAPPVPFASLIATSAPTLHTNALSAPAAPPHVDAQAIIDQVVRGMSVRQLADGSEVRMRLVPEHLGEVAIRLTVTGSSVSASVVAQNADVRQTLLANQHHLTRALEDSGLKLTGFSVDVFGGNAGNQKNTQDGASGFGRHYVVHELPANKEDPTLTAQPSFGPPQLAQASNGLLNHLV